MAGVNVAFAARGVEPPLPGEVTAHGALLEYCELTRQRIGQMFGESIADQVPVQVRIGILNQLNREAVSQIVRLFAEAIRELGGEVDQDAIEALLESRYGTSIAA